MLSQHASIFTAVILAVTAVYAWFVFAVRQAPVEPGRLERFARRHQLVITPANRDVIINYLETTRRWRATGVVVGFLASLAWTVTNEGLTINFMIFFAGWFVGALLAEARLARGSFGARRSASLVLRTPTRYLPRSAWLLLPAAAAASLTMSVVTTVVASRGGRVSATAAPLGAVALVLTLAVLAVQRHVLRRPQPVAEPDVVAADDAVRSRSLHVLAGAGGSLVFYCVFGQIAAVAPAPHGWQVFFVVVGDIAAIVVLLLGWWVANAPWPVRPSTLTTAAAEGEAQ